MLQSYLSKYIFRSMDNDATRRVKRLTDPRALRALAHPIRLSLLRLLRTEGPITATRAGDLLGESSASCSFHLRQLAKYGLAEEAGGGQGRERPWRATASLTDVPEVVDDPELAAAAQLFRSIVLERNFEGAMRWLEARADEPDEWQRSAQFNDLLLYLTAPELDELSQGIEALHERYADRLTRPELRPPGSRLVSYVQLAFPILDDPRGPHGRSEDDGDAL
jgi:DNA-binding transcriptional ArsR family regulator